MSAGEIRYRPGRPEDSRVLSELVSGVFTRTYGWSLSPEDLQTFLAESYAEPKLAADLQNPLMTFLVATKDDVAVGFAQLTRDSSDPCLDEFENKIELQRLYIHEDFQGMGIGKQLMLKAEEIAKDMGKKYMWLGVWENAEKPQKVYQKAGYIKKGEHGFKIASTSHTDWVLIKEL
jgi:ribosomal protein S18 acetylase RimI-like enzyme